MDSPEIHIHITIGTKCRNPRCSRPRKDIDRRGLCRRCYRDREIRDLFPKLPNKSQLQDVLEDLLIPLPVTPTDAFPGTEGKIEVLRQRAENREWLFHPGDARRIADFKEF